MVGKALALSLTGVFVLSVAALPTSPIQARCEGGQAYRLDIPDNAQGASYGQTSSFASYSFEPAFWVEFFGNASSPNKLTFDLLDRIYERGGRPIIRPGGITMDSMIFDPTAGDTVRTTNPAGGVYRTTVGPDYYRSWDNFPADLKFVSTLNFGNNSLDIARDLAQASVEHQSERIQYFELGNEPTNYNSSRWSNSTDAYVAQWKQWTSEIDSTIDQTQTDGQQPSYASTERWWASSATTDKSGLNVRPVDLIPAGIDSADQVAEYSIHSYAFATCDPARAARATLPNILNHTDLVLYADTEIMPSAQAALDAGKPWIIGEFNSIACSGQPNVSDTFAQALWNVDVELIYAARNASSVHLHQGATLVFQSNQQTNTAADDGSPGFSTYDFVYPQTSSKRGEARALPSFVAQLFMAEAMSTPCNTEQRVRVAQLPAPDAIGDERFAAYAFYHDDCLAKVAIINMQPYYASSTTDYSQTLDLSQYVEQKGQAYLKRMTAPTVNESDTTKATWAGQSFKDGYAHGSLNIETVGADGLVTVRGSEAVLVYFDAKDVYGL